MYSTVNLIKKTVRQDKFHHVYTLINFIESIKSISSIKITIDCNVVLKIDIESRLDFQ